MKNRVYPENKGFLKKWKFFLTTNARIFRFKTQFSTAFYAHFIVPYFSFICKKDPSPILKSFSIFMAVWLSTMIFPGPNSGFF